MDLDINGDSAPPTGLVQAKTNPTHMPSDQPVPEIRSSHSRLSPQVRTPGEMSSLDTVSSDLVCYISYRNAKQLIYKKLFPLHLSSANLFPPSRTARLIHQTTPLACYSCTPNTTRDTGPLSSLAAGPVMAPTFIDSQLPPYFLSPPCISASRSLKFSVSFMNASI